MRIFMPLFAAFALMAFQSVSAAETIIDRGAIAREIVRACAASSMARGLESAELHCACGVGVLSARTDDRQFYILGRLAPAMEADSVTFARVERDLSTDGFSEEEVASVSQLVQEAGDVAEATCRPLAD